ncbi:MAG: hypothetical protein M3Q22_10060, partial [Actinomycetota bacterium]|nr:hypothetical protein [Actinomycetota bacterium]
MVVVVRLMNSGAGMGLASRKTRAEVSDEGPVDQLLGSDVEVHLPHRRAGLVPGGEVGGDGIADPLADAADQTCFFGDADEIAGGQQARG